MSHGSEILNRLQDKKPSSKTGACVRTPGHGGAQPGHCAEGILEEQGEACSDLKIDNKDTKKDYKLGVVALLLEYNPLANSLIHTL